jgi:capsid protein
MATRKTKATKAATPAPVPAPAPARRPAARRAASIRNRYDVTSGENADGGRVRRPARVETGGEETVLRPYERLKAIGLVRDLMRNSPQIRGLSRTLRCNIVGPLGKLRFRQQDEWFAKAAKWFNDIWARAADFIDGSTWRECLQLCVHALAFDGEFVVVFDDGILTGATKKGGTGRLCFFEADKICNLDAAGFEPFKKKGMSQESGIIFDALGRKCGVVLAFQRGLTETSAEKAVVLTCDPDMPQNERNWLHVMRKFRLRQDRGVSDAVTAASTSLDSLEIMGLEMQSAKIGAARYATVYEKEPADSQDLGLLPDDDGKDGDKDGEDADNKDGEEDWHSPALENITGGNVDYLKEGDKVELAPTNRPNPNLAAFLDYASDVSGAAFGVSHAYSRLKADTSYTAFRGDIMMTWRVFEDFQQFLEDAFTDWVARRAIEHAVSAGTLDAPPSAEWFEDIAWQYPAPPSVDEGREASATVQKLKGGLTTYRDTLGPNWRDVLTNVAEEIQVCKKLGIPHPALETASGAVIEQPKDNQNED